MAVDDIYQITVHQSYLSQNLINVFYYRVDQDFGGTDANDLANEFLADVWAAVRGLQHADANTNRIVVINGMTNSDAVDVALDLDGTNISGSRLPAFLAVATRSTKGSPGERYSYKRFGGCPNVIGADGRWSGAHSEAIVAMTDNLGSDIASSAGTYTPIQLQVQVIGGKPVYFKLGVTPQVGRLLSGTWQYNAIPSHQDSRQTWDWRLASY